MITWRDIKSPFSGGAENLSHNILKELKSKYDITIWSSAFPNCKRFETIDGIHYVRMGSKNLILSALITGEYILLSFDIIGLQIKEILILMLL